MFAANAFALLGLRALYFLVSGLLDRLVYLSTGLSVILGVHRRQAGAALWAHARRAIPEISTPVSLGVIVAILTATALASVVASRRSRPRAARARRIGRPVTRDGAASVSPTRTPTRASGGSGAMSDVLK